MRAGGESTGYSRFEPPRPREQRVARNSQCRYRWRIRQHRPDVGAARRQRRRIPAPCRLCRARRRHSASIELSAQRALDSSEKRSARSQASRSNALAYPSSQQAQLQASSGGPAGKSPAFHSVRCSSEMPGHTASQSRPRSAIAVSIGRPSHVAPALSVLLRIVLDTPDADDRGLRAAPRDNRQLVGDRLLRQSHRTPDAR